MKSHNKYFLGKRVEEIKEPKYLPPLSFAQKQKEKIEVHACPLCQKEEYVVVGKFFLDHIIHYWVDRYGFNPISDAYRGDVLEKRYCENCGLFFYNYHLPDNDEMYEEMSKRSNYYPMFRPEYGMATEIIEQLRPDSVFEIGCGSGEFLERIKHIVPEAIGSEYNPEARKRCEQRGIKVYSQDISQIKEEFDVVCHFEVLEHARDTDSLMKNSLNLLKKGGLLMIGTPDPEGIASYKNRYQLNLPPHHQFDFSKKAFEFLAEKYKLKIYHYQKRELEYRHYEAYVKEITGKDLQQPDMVGFFEAQKRITGASHFVVFKKMKKLNKF